MTDCTATRTDGKPCAGTAIEGSAYCKYHAPLLGRHHWHPDAPVINEAAVTPAFCRWLEGDGWDVTPEVDFADVVAARDGITLVAEVKGQTSEPGIDSDILYGQLLRRMTNLSGSTRYALVVPERLLDAARRVPQEVRSRLKIEIYSVATDGRVTLRHAEG